MIHPWLAQHIERRARGVTLDYLAHRDLLVRHIELNEKETAYRIRLENGTTEELKRVTSLCDKWDKDLLFWGLTIAKTHGERAQAECYRIQQTAKQIGHEVHAYASGRMHETQERNDFTAFIYTESVHCAKLFDNWWDSVRDDFEVIATEFRVWNSLGKYAGTVDFALRHRKTQALTIGDIKTTDNISTGYKLQQGAYQSCLTNLAQPAARSFLLLLPKHDQGDHWIEHTLWSTVDESLFFQYAFMHLSGCVNALALLNRGKKRHGSPMARAPISPQEWAEKAPMSDEEVDELWAAFR